MMNLASNPERIFPLSGDTAVPGNFYTPRLLSQISATPGFVMGNRAFMRAWAARRAVKRLEAAGAVGSVAETERFSSQCETLTRSATQSDATSDSIS